MGTNDVNARCRLLARLTLNVLAKSPWAEDRESGEGGSLPLWGYPCFGPLPIMQNHSPVSPLQPGYLSFLRYVIQYIMYTCQYTYMQFDLDIVKDRPSGHPIVSCSTINPYCRKNSTRTFENILAEFCDSATSTVRL